MIKYRVGDLITAAENNHKTNGDGVVIAHCCNCFNTMKSGIAPLIAKAFPDAWAIDQATLKGFKGKLGTFSSAWGDGDVLVYNLYGQYGYWKRKQGGMDLDYVALSSAMALMSADLKDRCVDWEMAPEQVQVFLPKLGAGLAGGDWNVIEPMIQKHLGIFDVTIFTLE